MKYFLFSLLLTSFSCNRNTSKVLSDDNIIISDVVIDNKIGLSGPCEPSIAISPTNPNLIVAGSVLNNLYVSNDGGLTWSNSKLKSPFGVYGDPVVRFDTKGDVYYAHLSNPEGKAYRSVAFLDRIVVQKSIDGGENFDDGVYPPGDTLSDHDKHWLTVDPFTNRMLMAWTEFDEYGSKEESDRSRILFSVSDSEGKNWSRPTMVSNLEGDCIDDDKTTEGCTPAVGTDGTYFLVWAYNNALYFDKSKDQGKSWMKKDLKIANQIGGWSYDIPGLSRCNGMPIIEVDHSQSKHRGTIYINWSDQKNGPNDTDVWIISSKDNGVTWSKPIRVNNDKPGKHQFMSWMDVDPMDGSVNIVFYDRRAYTDNQTDVYLARSLDGGKSFKNIKINATTFTPNTNVFFGDYNDISAQNGKVRPIWTQQKGVSLSVHTAIIDFPNK